MKLGNSFLLTRDADGRFRAFLNVCRHRGAQIVEIGRGRKRRFTCPFHAWNYSNSGELIAINRESSFGCVDKNGLGLTELPCLEANGMLWVRPTVGNSFTEADVMGGLSSEFENWLKDEHFFSEAQVIEADINWKLAIDTFGENYHLTFYTNRLWQMTSWATCRLGIVLREMGVWSSPVRRPFSICTNRRYR